MNLDPRFRIEATPRAVAADACRFDYDLVDSLTGSSKRYLQEADALKAQERRLQREASTPWGKICSYDFFLSPISRAAVEVYAHNEQGERLHAGADPMVLIGYDRDCAKVQEKIHRWLIAMGHPELKRTRDLQAERERQLEASVLTEIIPGVRSRPSLLN